MLLLHGVGSHEGDLLGLAPHLDGRFFVVSARAPITLGPGSYAWFHVEFTPAGPVINPQEAESSRLALLRVIGELVEAYALDPKRVFLAGFSQGAIMSLSVALTAPDKVAGVVAMSGRILPEVLLKMAPPEALAGLPRRALKAIRVGPGFAPAEAERYAGSAAGLLLDTRAEGAPGGTGRTFDWSLVQGLRERCPFLVLAGGLTPETVGEAIRLVRPHGVDVSSGVESSPGRKDPEKVRAFVAAVRSAET